MAESLSGTQTWEDPEFSAWAKSTFPNSVGTSVLADYPIKSGKSAGTFETAQQYFGATCGTSATDNIPCGTAPATGTEGNLKRDTYRNPGMAQVDASLMKNNPINWLGAETNLQFRFDFLNVLNHVNLGAVDANMADSTFGKVTSALGSRQLQLGLRIAY